MDVASLPIEVRKANKDDDTLEFVASTDAVDRAGDVIAQNWDLKAFRKNPVFLYGHQYSDLPVGKIIKIWTESIKKDNDSSKRTMIRVKFVPEEIYPFAGTVKRMYEEKFLGTVSVGFRPLERKELSAEEREELGMGRWGEFFKKSELLEVSAVTVPMNPEAVQSGITKGLWKDESEACDIREGIRRDADTEAILKMLGEIENEFEEETCTTGNTHATLEAIPSKTTEELTKAVTSLDGSIQELIGLFQKDDEGTEADSTDVDDSQDFEFDIDESDLEEALAGLEPATQDQEAN